MNNDVKTAAKPASWGMLAFGMLAAQPKTSMNDPYLLISTGENPA